MTKRIKLFLISILTVFAISLLAMVSFNGGVANNNVKDVFADYSTSVETEDGSLGIHGIYINVPNGQTDAYYGVKFRGYVPVANYNSAAYYGLEIIPTDLISDPTKAYDCGNSKFELNEQDGKYYFYGAVVDIRENNITRPYSARAYVKVGGEKTLLTDWTAGKSIFTVSTQAVLNAQYADNVKLNQIIATATDSAKTGYYSYDSFSVTAPAGKTLTTLATGDVITVNSTLTNGTNTLDVYPKLTAVNVDGSGEELSGVLELVENTSNQYTVNLDSEKAFKIKQTVGSVSTVGTDNLVEENTMLVSSASDILTLRSAETSKNAVLTQDITGIDITEKSELEYSGVFDGNNHKMTFVKIQGEPNGLFYKLSNATIKDVDIDGGSPSSHNLVHNQSGVLAHQIGAGSSGPVTVSNVTIKGFTLRSDISFQGVMFGRLYNCELTVKDCVVFADDLDFSRHGALAGRHESGTVNIINSYFVVDGQATTNLVSSNEAGQRDTTNGKALSTTALSGYATAELGADITNDISSVSGTINRVFVGNTEVDFTVSASTLTIANEQVASLTGGEYKLYLMTADKLYEQNLALADKVVTQETDLRAIAKNGFTGYAILANDIESVTAIFNDGYGGTFNGTFDGLGHKIANVTLNKAAGIFGTTVQNSTIKNLVLENVSIAADQAGVLGGRSNGTINIENVIISATVTGTVGNFAGGLFANSGRTYKSTLNVTDSMIYMPTENANVGAMVGSPSDSSSNTTINITNSYVISPNTIVSTGNLHGSNTNYKTVADALNSANAGIVYANAADLRDKVEDNTITTLTAQQLALLDVLAPASTPA